MKFALIVLVALFSTLAFADLAEEHQKNCETAEVKALMGEKGSCRIVIAPKKFVGSGVCTGKFMNAFNCKVTYIAEENQAALNITCMGEGNLEIMNQDMEAQGINYNVATLIKTSEGANIIQNDKKEYKIVASSSLSVSVKEGTADIAMIFSQGPTPLTEVVCK